MKTGRELGMLQDVISYFGKNPEKRRCVDNNGNCVYNPPKNSESAGCAIGMYLSVDVAKKLDKIGIIDNVFDNKSKKKLLPQWMRDMDIEFLSSIQELHDYGNYWNVKGLSMRGRNEVKQICISHKIPFSKLKL